MRHFGTLAQEINRIIKVVKGNMEGSPFVCIAAMDGMHETTIRGMVKRHIGKQITMDGFLEDKLGRKNTSNRLVNEYRILMLQNMKKMMKEKA